MTACEHGRDCEECPAEMLQMAGQHLHQAMDLMLSAHEHYDSLEIENITAELGCVKAILWIESKKTSY